GADTRDTGADYQYGLRLHTVQSRPAPNLGRVRHPEARPSQVERASSASRFSYPSTTPVSIPLEMIMSRVSMLSTSDNAVTRVRPWYGLVWWVAVVLMMLLLVRCRLACRLLVRCRLACRSRCS